MEIQHRFRLLAFMALASCMGISCRDSGSNKPESNNKLKTTKYVEAVFSPSEFDGASGVTKVHHDRDEKSRAQYIVHDKRGVHFCDSNFQIIITIPTIETTKILASRMGRYTFITEYVHTAEDESRIRLIKYTLADYQGTILWKKSERYVWDDMKNVGRCISDIDGHLFEYVDITSTLSVYDKQGKVLNTYTLFDEERLRSAQMDISRRGNLVAIIASRRPHEKEPCLFLFNSDGSIRVATPLEGTDISTVSVGPEGELILVSTWDDENKSTLTTYVLSANGECLFTIPMISHNPVITASSIIKYNYDQSIEGFIVSSYDRTRGTCLWSMQVEKPVGIIMFEENPNIAGIVSRLFQDWICDYRIIVTSTDGKPLQTTTIEDVPAPSVTVGGWHRNRVFNSGLFVSDSSRSILRVVAIDTKMSDH